MAYDKFSTSLKISEIIDNFIEGNGLIKKRI